MRAVRFFLITMMCVLGLGSATFAIAGPIDKIIVFGDSLSDTGNLFRLTSDAHQLITNVPIIPKNPPYFEGRFTNGWNWIDDLKNDYQVPVDNYAVGGSWAEPILDSKFTIPFGLDVQVTDYFLRHPFDRHRDRHLYIIWAGSNDYAHGRDNQDYATSSAVGSIRRQIETLISYGAKNIFVVGVPDLSLVPEVRALGAKAMMDAHDITAMHNQKLATMMEAEQKQNPMANLMLYDITNAFSDIFNNPEKYNIKVTLTACYNGGYYFLSAMSSQEIEAAKDAHMDLLNNPVLHTAYITAEAAALGEPVCANQDDYLFFDTIHPTRVIHKLIADNAFAYLRTHGINSGLTEIIS